MSTPTTDEVTAYVDGVREALRDLPDGTRNELLDDLPEHLAEVLAEGEGTLTQRLGSPQAYAAELRAAAGIVGGSPAAPEVPTDRLGVLVANVRRNLAVVRRNLDVADERMGPLVGYPRVSAFLVQLRPAWWVLRGYLVAMVVAQLLDDRSRPLGLLPRVGDSDAIALFLLFGGVAGSIWLGRRTPGLSRLPQVALRAGTVVLALVALAGFADVDERSRTVYYDDVAYQDPVGNIRDVYVYDRQGRLLTGVRVFDQDGRPILFGSREASGCLAWDPNTNGELRPAVPSPDDGYPYCPELAPFRGPGPQGSTDPSPSPATPGPAPSAPPAPGPTLSASSTAGANSSASAVPGSPSRPPAPSTAPPGQSSSPSAPIR